MKLIFFLTFCFAVYGPKFGYIDTSALFLTTPLLILLFKKKRTISIVLVYIIISVIITWAYSLGIFLFINNDADIYMLQRNTRTLITTVLLSYVIYNCPINVPSALKLFTVALSLHPFAIFTQIIFPQSKEFFASIYLFDKSYVGMRAFGLTAGYDTAGYLCILGYLMCILCFLYVQKVGKPFYLVMAIVFFSASILTSRSAMLASVVLAFLICIIIFIRGNVYLRLASIFFIMGIVCVSIVYIMPIILNTISYDDYNLPLSEEHIIYNNSFAPTELGDWKEEMWFLPGDEKTLIFGGALNVSNTDVAYIKIIFMMGLIGLAMILSTYFLMFLMSVIIYLEQKKFHNNLLKALVCFLVIAIPLQLIFNIKALFFYGRGFHEFIVIVFVFLITLLKENRKGRNGVKANESSNSCWGIGNSNK